MLSLLGDYATSSATQPLARRGGRQPHGMDRDLKSLERREWWLWLSAVVVSVLSAVAFLLASLPALFPPDDPVSSIRSDQAVEATLALVLLFQAWLVYRLWFFRGMRKQSVGRTAGASGNAEQGSLAVDPVTGFYTRASLEQRLARETASARRNNTPLSLVALHLEDFSENFARKDASEAGQVLKEFARRLKRATRGSDFGAQLGGDDFLLVLPECDLTSAKHVLERLGTLEMKCGGQNVILNYSAAWIDYQPGESPASLLDRAGQVLQLYNKAAKDSALETVALR